MKCENYSLENLRNYLSYAIEHITDKATLYNAWTKFEKQMLNEPARTETESKINNELETIRTAISRMATKVNNENSLWRALAVLDEAYKQALQ